MSDEIQIAGAAYVPSKRAAQISGYSQDYIGQLCRAGLIEAKRIGGLWYIGLDSLYKHKQKADSYMPVAPRKARVAETEAFISFDGKDYVSAARAAEITGYHQDYVGQLARSGKILSRQAGNRWYVERSGIVEHKRQKDALLAAVQAEAVGISRLPANTGKNLEVRGHERYDGAGPYLKYSSDSGDLLPQLSAMEAPVHEPSESLISSVQSETKDIDVHAVPIRVLRVSASPPEAAATHTVSAAAALKRPESRHFSSSVALIPAALATIVIVLSVGYVSFGGGAVYTQIKSASPDTAMALAAQASGVFSRIVDVLEEWLAPEIVYLRET